MIEIAISSLIFGDAAIALGFPITKQKHDLDFGRGRHPLSVPPPAQPQYSISGPPPPPFIFVLPFPLFQWVRRLGGLEARRGQGVEALYIFATI